MPSLGSVLSIGNWVGEPSASLISKMYDSSFLQHSPSSCTPSPHQRSQMQTTKFFSSKVELMEVNWWGEVHSYRLNLPKWRGHFPRGTLGWQEITKSQGGNTSSWTIKLKNLGMAAPECLGFLSLGWAIRKAAFLSCVVTAELPLKKYTNKRVAITLTHRTEPCNTCCRNYNRYTCWGLCPLPPQGPLLEAHGTISFPLCQKKPCFLWGTGLFSPGGQWETHNWLCFPFCFDHQETQNQIWAQL